jgi:hypothetical protein
MITNENNEDMDFSKLSKKFLLLLHSNSSFFDLKPLSMESLFKAAVGGPGNSEEGGVGEWCSLTYEQVTLVFLGRSFLIKN